jgi:hypothetical protein
MVTKGIKYLQEEVRKVFDEIGVNQAKFLEMDIDDSNLDTEIDSKIIEAVRYVHMSAIPARLYDSLSGKDFDSAISSGDIKKMTITIPDDIDLLRITKLNLSDWIYPVFSNLSDDSPEYHKQSDKYACGTYESPIVFLLKNSSGIYLECFSAKASDSKLETLFYLPEPVINNIYSERQIDICALCERAIVYRTAGLTLTNYSQNDKAKICFELCETNMK